MGYRILVLALVLLATACSNAPTSEDAPSRVDALPPAAQRPTETIAAPSRADPVTGASDALRDPNSIPSTRSVFFDYDQSLVKDSDKRILRAHADYLRQHPRARIVAQGNTDERGTREYNIALGQQRAEAVRRFLILLGAEDRQIDTVSFGKEKPGCTPSEESCWTQNRRVDLAYPGG
jgi:peptidoglycan-associated lipoprotein